jgi:short-subunit dehydrogenase
MTAYSGTTIITGASRGIGEAIARILASKIAAEHGKLVLVARDEDRLKHLSEEIRSRQQTDCEYFICDLADREAVQRLIDKYPKASVLINNAGFIAYGSFHKLTWQLQNEMIEVNVTALTRLCYHYVQDMVKDGYGKILNVASTAGMVPSPYISTYVGTKAYVMQFSKSLFMECKDKGIVVSCLLPGPTKTDFWHSSKMSSKVEKVMGGYDDPRGVAEIGIRLLEEGGVSVVPGLKNRIKCLIKYLLPERVLLYLAKEHMIHESLDRDLDNDEKD